MSCLLPQFKSLPDSFSIHFKPHHHHTSSQPLKYKDPIYFRAQCSATVTPVLYIPSIEDHSNPAAANRPGSPSTSTVVLDLEKLHSASLGVHSNFAATNSPWTYFTDIDPATEASFGASLPTEKYVASKEAVIAAAASEAVALAREAAKSAKDAAMMLAQIRQTVEVVVVGESEVAESECGSDVEEPTAEDAELLQAELLKSVAVRSRRQLQRKARRARAAKKTSSTVVSVKSGPTSQNKRGVQEVHQSDPLWYLRQTDSSSGLLTAAEEQELSQGIQVLLRLEKIYKELSERYGGEPSFRQWAVAAGVDRTTLRRQINYGTFCKDKMIKSNVRLVVSIAKKYLGTGMNFQDLVQEGCRGLVKGAEKFDASKGFKFSTYAHWWIKQAVRKFLSDQSRTIRLPFHMVDATYKVKEARRNLYNANGRQASDEEIAEATGLSMRRLSAVLLVPKAPRSLDQNIGFSINLKPSEITADPEAETSEELLIKQSMRQDLERVLNTLKPREKEVVKCRFGLDDGRMKTLQEIGELMGVSRERIRQIELCAFRKLKNKRRTKRLHQYQFA
ncbi:RNA polymerase sigma factor [Heracleum sosnowskyi]|uniref:RNA polymerase sigma factor n=1 Tax=Heracleum sosnowskyi TaxID=360622 RepID=A0AAD8HCM1_9APIA|nr:RNA polymerase sigma factor [Heracleum sosnowskyi]